MIKVWDFRCQKGHVTEHFIDADAVVVQCPKCFEPAMRLLAAPRAKLEGITGSFPSAADAWERNRASHMAKERESVRSNREYLNGTPASDAGDTQ